MTPIFSRIAFPFLSLLFAGFSFVVPHMALAQATDNKFHGAAYQLDEQSRFDYRNISTLNEFDRLVSRGRWAGIDAGHVLAELDKFKGTGSSPALREIWRNVLLGDFNGLRFANPLQQSYLMADRIRLLNHLGYFDEAVRLYLLASQNKPIPQAIAKEGINALALSGSADGACLEVLMAARHLQGDEWNQNAALCSAYFGESDKAAEYYNRVADGSVEGFSRVFKMLSANGEHTVQSEFPPLWRALLIAKGAGVSRKMLQQSNGETVASIALNEKIPLGLRVFAAERAADFGTIGPERLRKLYEAQYPSAGSVASFASSAQKSDKLSPAQLYSAARFTFEGNARASIVQNALKQLDPITHLKGQVYGWIVDKLTLQVEKLGWFAPHGFALMTVTNRRNSADMYYQAGQLADSPLSIVHALLEQKPWSPQAQTAWLDAMERSGRQDQIVKAYQLARAFDQENKLGLKNASIIEIDSLKSKGLLDESIRKGGKGLTLLNTLNYLALSRRISDLNTQEIHEIVSNLGKQGLFGERKKIALEILLQIVL